jgi:hypothetical protein
MRHVTAGTDPSRSPRGRFSSLAGLPDAPSESAKVGPGRTVPSVRTRSFLRVDLPSFVLLLNSGAGSERACARRRGMSDGDLGDRLAPRNSGGLRLALGHVARASIALSPRRARPCSGRPRGEGERSRPRILGHDKSCREGDRARPFRLFSLRARARGLRGASTPLSELSDSSDCGPRRRIDTHDAPLVPSARPAAIAPAGGITWERSPSWSRTGKATRTP